MTETSRYELSNICATPAWLTFGPPKVGNVATYPVRLQGLCHIHATPSQPRSCLRPRLNIRLSGSIQHICSLFARVRAVWRPVFRLIVLSTRTYSAGLTACRSQRTHSGMYPRNLTPTSLILCYLSQYLMWRLRQLNTSANVFLAQVYSDRCSTCRSNHSHTKHQQPP
jgi:hypothetical protein